MLFDKRWEQVQVPVVPLEPWRQLLLDAAQHVRKWGWCQFELQSPSGEVCTLGAVRLVSFGDGGEVCYREAKEGLCRFLGISSSVGNLPAWNDTPGRTKEEVIAALEGAACQEW